jgi:D-glycero-D-manno-heptose 1,7-bisphosphate phosphatase
MKPGAFLDRDGVINASIIRGGLPFSPKSLSDVKILPGVREAIDLLKANGYVPIVITNQPDIARESAPPTLVSDINEYIKNRTGIDHFYVCPHDNFDRCECRKPKPGLITKASKDLGLELDSSFLVGDRWKDIKAGQEAGIPTYFIDYLYNEVKPTQPFIRVSSLLEAVKLRLGGKIET